MAMTHRMQLLLEPEQYERLAAVAASQHRSIASLIRDAIDASVPAPANERMAAFQRIMAAEPTNFGTPEELRAELDAIRGL
ncbi:MAG: antitoxin [Actinobacteria bacterium]|uniref:Unannotated protein n=1 Tax=freshwater metagenome TaxID=449393 RepID=A0A6J7RDN8_9ZZZZ|nr:antitoxin [Actinomycetota bacterium]